MSSSPATSAPTRPPVANGLTVTTRTPDGPFTVVADESGHILASGWTAKPEPLLALIHTDIRPTQAERTTGLANLADAVEAYYAGDLAAVSAVPVRQHTNGTFLARAWQVLREVPPGTPVSYTRFAELAGEPTAVRAAAAACARNAAALFVPCHRVLRSDGSLGGFRWGLDVKRSLLAHEDTATDSRR